MMMVDWYVARRALDGDRRLDDSLSGCRPGCRGISVPVLRFGRSRPCRGTACCAEHADKTPLANCKPASALNLPEQSPSCPHCELRSHQVDASRMVRSAEPVEWGFFAALIAETGETIVPVVPRLPSTERLEPIEVPTHQERQAQLCRWLA